MKFDFTKQNGFERLKNTQASFLQRIKDTTKQLQAKKESNIYKPMTERKRINNKSKFNQEIVKNRDNVYNTQKKEISQLKTKRVMEMSKFLEFGRSSRTNSKGRKASSFIINNREQIRSSFYDNIKRAKETVYQTKKKNMNTAIDNNKQANAFNKYRQRITQLPNSTVKKKESNTIESALSKRAEKRMVLGKVKLLKNITDRFRLKPKKKMVLPIIKKGIRISVLK